MTGKMKGSDRSTPQSVWTLSIDWPLFRALDFKTEAGKKLLDERTSKPRVSYFIRETLLGELCLPVIEAQ